MEMTDAYVMCLLNEVQQLLMLSSMLQAASLIQWDLGRTGKYYSLQRECAADRRKASAILYRLGFPELMEIDAEMDRLSKEPPEEQSELVDYLLKQYRKIKLSNWPNGSSWPQQRVV